MLVNVRDLKKIRQAHIDEIIVFACGVFDLFHVGHLNYLKRCKKEGDILLVNVANDKRVKEVKGIKRPIIGQRQRASIVNSINYVDYVTVNSLTGNSVTVDCLKRLKPNKFVVHSLEKRTLFEQASPEIEIVKKEQLNYVSTTSIIDIIQSLG